MCKKIMAELLGAKMNMNELVSALKGFGFKNFEFSSFDPDHAVRAYGGVRGISEICLGISYGKVYGEILFR